MGGRDIAILIDINSEVSKFCKKNKLPFTFKADHGSYETAIEFWAMGYNHPPKSKNWDEADGNKILCPDLLDWEHRLIIEYEEEGGKSRPGARLSTKGHGREGDISNSRDTDRNYYYRIAGFKLLRFWEADSKNKNFDKLYKFLKS